MKIEKLTGVLCCGNVCLDMPVWPVERIAWGTTTWVEAIGESLGGNGANTSYALARLGVPVRLTGLVGDDEKGVKLTEALIAAGIDTTHVRVTSEPTTSTVVVVHPSGDRLFLHLPGASKSLDVDDVDFSATSSFSHFHFANPFSLPKLRTRGAELLTRARDAGLTTSLDTGWDSRERWMDDIADCMPLADLLFVNETELRFLTGMDEPVAAAARLREAGAGSIVVKLGSRGCVLFDGPEAFEAPAFRVPVKDTTGAGDSFVGGFLAALHYGRSYREAAVFANAVGALKVQHLGAAQGVRSFADTERWIRDYQLESKLEGS